MNEGPRFEPERKSENEVVRLPKTVIEQQKIPRDSSLDSFVEDMKEDNEEISQNDNSYND